MSQTKAQLLEPQGDFTLTSQLIGVGATFSGNVSIAGTLTKQDVTNVDSVGVITARAGIEVIAGDVIIPDKIVHRGDTNTAIRFSGNDQITFETNGDQALEITSGGGVKYNNADSPSSTTTPAQILNHSGGWQFYGSSDSGTHRNIIFGTNNASAGERLRITSQGSVGINSTSPVGTLDVRTTVGTGSTVFIYAANHNTSAASEAELRFGFAHSGSPEGIGYIKLKENGNNVFDGNLVFGVPNNNGSGGSVTNDVLYIKGSNQSVGIGDEAPDALLSIKGDSNQNSNPSIRLKDGTDTRENWISNVSGDLFLAAGGNDNVYHSRIRLMDGNMINFDIDNGLRATIDADGISDAKGNLRSIPRNNQGSAYTLVAADAGKCITAGGNITVDNSVFVAGDVVSIIADTGSTISIVQGSGVTMYNTGDASTGSKTLAARGMCTIWFVAANNCYLSGSGIS